MVSSRPCRPVSSKIFAILESTTMELDAALQGLPAELRDAVAREWGHYVSSAREQGIDIAVLAPVIASVPCVWAGSAFVVQHCVRAPGLLADLVGSGDLERVYAASFYGECLTRSLGVIDNEAALARELRLFRAREMLRIAWRDLAGWADLQETLRDLSNLASACLDSALRCLDTWQAAEWGVATGARSGARQGLVVVGMGKLGAGELNFSSDIDLIFAYPEDGETVGGARTLSNEDYFRRLAQRLIQAINAPMAEGFVFRVVLWLRPFGDSGSLEMSFDAMEEYYQSHGREWERYAWIKAAAVAGDRTAGEKLLHLLRPFVFRRYLDFGAYRTLREMKALIEEQVKRKGMEDNVKLGAGGIREIEFIGQAYQLIRGGRETELQARPIVTVLHRLVERGYLPAHAGADLVAAYEFLRRTENRLQEYADQQTHRLPQDATDRARLAYTMGHPRWEEFARQLDHHRRRVHSHFEYLFAAPEGEDGREADAPRVRAWRGGPSDHEIEALLAAAGYSAPAEARERITHLRDGREQQRHQVIEAFATLRRELAAGGGVAQVGDPLARLGRGRVARGGEQGLDLVIARPAAPRPYERRIGLAPVFSLRRREEIFEVTVHATAMVVELSRELFPARMAHRIRERRAIRRVLRQAMRLLIGIFLQTVFGAAQKFIGRHQVGAGVCRQIAAFHETMQHSDDGPRLQLGLTTATDQLKGLADELDLADAAGAELDVVFHALAFDLFLDQGLHLAQRAIGAEIEIAAEDEGAQQVQQFFAGGAVARHCRRLDPGVPLPLAAVALVILFHRIEAHHQRTAVAERTQPHVDAKDEALGHRRVDRLNETLGEAAEIIFIRECPRATHGLTVLWIGEDQVDVGGNFVFVCFVFVFVVVVLFLLCVAVCVCCFVFFCFFFCFLFVF